MRILLYEKVNVQEKNNDTNYGFSYPNYISVCNGFAYLEGKSLFYTTNTEEL